jgi:5'(3')-deoxyribonucleotidase
MLPNNIFQQHTHVWLDLDETLAETFPWLLEYAHKNGQLLMIPSVEHITSYDFTNIDPSISLYDARNIWEWFWKSTMHPATVPIVPFARDWVQRLIDLGLEISIITARSDKESWKVERTKDWVLTHFPEIWSSKIAFVNHFSDDSEPKSGACREHGVTLLIDDSIENAYDLSKEGIASIILEKPWNRDIIFDHPLVYKVKDWQEIIKYIHAHG